MHGSLNALESYSKDSSHLLTVCQTSFLKFLPAHCDAQVPSPPLDIRPLVVSGSPHNRVDLVFFSDGCMS